MAVVNSVVVVHGVVVVIFLALVVAVQGSNQCHQCTSGGVNFYQFSGCPANGSLNGWQLRNSKQCQGQCVTTIKRFPLGEVVRGCSKQFWLPSDLPDTGCHTFESHGHTNDLYCFCQGDKCNTLDVTSERAQMVRRQMKGYWDYKDTSEWIKQWPACLSSSSSRQSPIKLDWQNTVALPQDSLQFQGYDSSIVMMMSNNGHAAVAKLDSNDYVTISGIGLPGTFRAIQLHFHWGDNDFIGSEHQWRQNGVDIIFPLELHIVHVNIKYDIETALEKDDGLAVLGVMYELSAGEDNADLEPIVNKLKGIRGTGKKITLPAMKLSDLMPSDVASFFRYPGSLTTPSCNEAVTWTSFKEAVPITSAQLSNFRKLKTKDKSPLVNNFRPLQPINRRIIGETGA